MLVGLIAMFGYIIKEVFRKIGAFGRGLVLRVLCRRMFEGLESEKRAKRVWIVSAALGSALLCGWLTFVLYCFFHVRSWWGSEGDSEDAERFLLMGIFVAIAMVLTVLFNIRGFRTATLLMECLCAFVLLCVSSLWVPNDARAGV